MDKSSITLFIKNKSRELGFSFCGISKADFLKRRSKKYEIWLKKNMQGKMDYMKIILTKGLTLDYWLKVQNQ